MGIHIIQNDFNSSDFNIDSNGEITLTRTRGYDITLSGTSGTADITLSGISPGSQGYLTTFNTDLATTASDFVTTHSANLNLSGITVTSNGNILTFKSSIEISFSMSIVNSTGNLDGAVANIISFGSRGTTTSYTAVNSNITTNATAPTNIFGVFDTTSSWTITIASDDIIAGMIFIIRDESGGAGTSFITITTEGSELIDSVNSIDINQDNGVVRLYSDGIGLYTW